MDSMECVGMSMDSMENIHGFHGKCPGCPRNPWTFYRQVAKKIDCGYMLEPSWRGSSIFVLDQK